MQDKKQLITIKGTREGLTLFIDETCSFSEAIKELHEKIKKINQKKRIPLYLLKLN